MKLNVEEMSSFLMYRMCAPEATQTINKYFPNRIPVTTSQELEGRLKDRVQKLPEGKTALALSGGIDSAILAKFMPKGSVAYTFKCIVPGIEVTNETPVAAKYAKECGLEHRIVEIYWDDFKEYSERLMKHKKAPIHSIEVQIYKALLRAKEDGIETVVFGEAADVNIVLPFPETYMASEMDYDRIRRGENKYLVRKVFQRLYPEFMVPPKTPMPRPMNEWLKDWKGPKRQEFWENCAEDLTGDQKWLLWSLEAFLNM